jgi:hypothetical protein
MAINVIVVAVTLMMGGFVAVWIVSPRSRAWFEAPKLQPLGWDQPPPAPEEGCRCGDLAMCKPTKTR